MADLEALNQRLARLAVSRQQSWEAVREAQTLVRTGIAKFEQRVPRWVKPTPASPSEVPPQQTWYERLPPRFWRILVMVTGAVFGAFLVNRWGAG